MPVAPIYRKFTSAEAQITSSIQQAVATHGHDLHFVAAHTANVANAVAQHCPSACVPPCGSAVEHDAPVTRHLKRIPSASVPVNPKLPPYDGSTDPSLRLRQVNAAFEAYRTTANQHLRWLVLTFREHAMLVLLLNSTNSTVQRFPPYLQGNHLQQQLHALHVQPGGYLSYSDCIQTKDTLDSLIHFCIFLSSEPLTSSGCKAAWTPQTWLSSSSLLLCPAVFTTVTFASHVVSCPSLVSRACARGHGRGIPHGNWWI